MQIMTNIYYIVLLQQLNTLNNSDHKKYLFDLVESIYHPFLLLFSKYKSQALLLYQYINHEILLIDNKKSSVDLIYLISKVELKLIK